MSSKTPSAHILVVDDEKNMCRILAKILRGQGYEVSTATSAGDALKILSHNAIDVVISDVRMPGMDGMELLEEVRRTDADIAVIMMTAYPSVEDAVRVMNAGAYNYIQKPFNNDEVILTVERALERKNLVQKDRFRTEQMEARYGLENLIGDSEVMQQVRETIRRIAPTGSTVLITGESGTGKELVARAVHQLSDRSKGNFVAINCGALPRELLESEVFGHERGAFTDAKDLKKGLVEVASGGSLFLDEVGELPVDLQSKFLRTIETQEFRRLGSTSNRKIDVRFIAATNRNLEQDVEEGRFRKDFYYRLNTLRVDLPPLRDRKEDISRLVEYFIAEQNEALRKRVSGVSKRAMQGLLRYEWPGNVRELQKCIERAMILTDETVLEFERFGLPAQLLASSETRAEIDQWDESTVLPYRKAREIFERQYFENLLRLNEENVSRSALAAGISRRHLQEKMKQLGLSRSAGEEDLEED